MHSLLYIPLGVQQFYELWGILLTGCTQRIPSLLGHWLGSPGQFQGSFLLGQVPGILSGHPLGCHLEGACL
jgi:hypothetical protein